LVHKFYNLVVINDETMDALWIVFVTLFFVFGLPILFVVFYFERIHKPLEQAKISAPREVIVKEIVMVPCQYCGGLMPQTSSFCPGCGAPRKS
jgi:hypothetical protein